MQGKYLALIPAVAILAGCPLVPRRSFRPLAYPSARVDPLVEKLHGREVADPYRWLEDSDSDETGRWIAAQRKLTRSWFGEVLCRSRLEKRLRQLWDYEKYGIPVKKGDRWFYSHNRGLQNQPVLYTTASLGGTPRVLLDPNSLSADGTVALAGISISRDGSHLAYGLSSAGSDWTSWRIREVATGRDLAEILEWTKFTTPAWDNTGKGFYYSRYPQPEGGDKLQAKTQGQILCYHRLGTPQSADQLIHSRPDRPRWGFQPQVTEDGRWLLVTVFEGTARANMVLHRPLAGGGELRPLVGSFDARWILVGSEGERFWFHTDLKAPRGRIVALERGAPERLRTLVDQGEDTIRAVSLVNRSFLVSYLHHAASRVRIFDLEGKHLRDLELPGLGLVTGLDGRPGDRETFYRFASFNDPGSIYRLDLVSGRSTLHRRPLLAFDPDRFRVERVFYGSADGTRIPMFLAYRKGLEFKGRTPTILYGYGGFNMPMTPSFKVSRLAWMELGGLFACACIRGGGEYGREWHRAGSRENKSNCFDDFIAAARWLRGCGYTRPSRLAIQGGSNGGLLVGACMVRQPGLFGACLPAVGVLDMLRFHKFTIGWAWTSDYGSPDEEEDFNTLLAYSPYHNIRPGQAYPPTLVTTADHDDRVVPAHSYKFTARLQAAQGGPAPILIRIQGRAGHGGGKPTEMRITETRDVLSFLIRVLDIPY